MAGKGRKFTFFGAFRTKREAVAHEKGKQFVIPCHPKHKSMFCVVKKKGG